MVSILFVCTGNICRSPTAEGIMRQQLHKRGLTGKYFIDSAGTHGYHAGEPPDKRAIQVADKRRIPIEDLTSRALTDEDYQHFDLLLGMDVGHVLTMQRRLTSEATARIELFRAYAGIADALSADAEVPDPYHGSMLDFERVLDLCEEGVEGLITRLERDYP